MKSMIDLYCGSAAIKDGKAFLSAGRQRRYERRSDAAGRTVLSAKYSDSFNFVDLARVVISADGAAVDSASCSCPRFNDEKGLCCHCAALLLKYEETDKPLLVHSSGKSASEEESTVPDPETTEETIVPDEVILGGDENSRGILDYSFRFCNVPDDLYPGVQNPMISKDSFEMIFGKTLQVQELYDGYKKWEGSCYGIATASGMFVHPDDVSPSDYHAGARRPIDLDLADRNQKIGITLHRFIEAMQVSQCAYHIGQFRKLLFSMPLQAVLEGLVDSVDSFEQTGQDPVVLEMFVGHGKEGGHAVFPYRYEQQDALHSRLHIYDSNYPGQVRYMDLTKDEAGNYLSWRYYMNYSSENNNMLGFIPHTLYQLPWNERASRRDEKPRALFSTPCEDLTVQDENGNDVLRIAAGCVTPMRDDVIPIRITAGEAVANRYDCWIDQGVYRVINNDPERELDCKMVGEELGIEIKTEAKEATVTLNEEEQLVKIEIAEKKKPLYVKILSIAKDIVIKCITSYLTGINIIPTILSLAGKLFFKYIASDSISEFTVNGEAADVRDYATIEENDCIEDENHQDSFEETVNDEVLYILNSKKSDPKE